MTYVLPFFMSAESVHLSSTGDLLYVLLTVLTALRNVILTNEVFIYLIVS